MSDQDKNRGTGRTERIVVRAVCAMLMGKTVVHVSASPGSTDHALAYARDWLRTNGWSSQHAVRLAIDTRQQIIRFGTGVLRFTSIDNPGAVRGYPRSTIVLDDHAVAELRVAAEKKQARVYAKAQVIKLMDEFGWECVQSGRQFTDGRKEFWTGPLTKDEA